MFILGIGLSAVGYFIWFIAALFLSWLIMHSFRLRIKLMSAVLGFLFFLLGASTVLYHYFKVNFFRNILFSSFSHTPEGINNILFFKNAYTRLSQLNFAIKGWYSYHWTWLNWLQFLPFLLLCVSFGFLLYMILFNKKTVLNRQNIAFILFLFSFYLISTCITITGLWDCHLLGPLPFALMIIAIAFHELYMRYRKWLFLSFIITPLFLLSLFYLQECFGLYRFSEKEKLYNKQCNIEMLVNYLLKDNIRKVVFLSPEEHYGAMFYSRFAFGRDFSCKYWQPTEKVMYDSLAALPSDTTLVLREPDIESSRPIDKCFKTAIQRLNKEMSEVRIIGTAERKYLIFKLK